MQEDENQGSDLFDDLAEKAIQWEPTSDKSRNNNPISSNGSIHSIESSIAVEARIANLSRRLELPEIREPISVNQVSPNPIQNSGCTYCQAMNHVFKEHLVFQAQQMLTESRNVAFSRTDTNSYSQTYNPGWKNHPNFL